MIIIAYVLIAAAAIGMVYYGSLLGGSQFYMSIFSAAIICYCIYLDYKNRKAKKANENTASKSSKTSNSGQKIISSKKAKETPSNIAEVANKKRK